MNINTVTDIQFYCSRIGMEPIIIIPNKKKVNLLINYINDLGVDTT